MNFLFDDMYTLKHFFSTTVSPSISVRLFFDKTWECYLTDFYDERTIDFGQKLLLVVSKVRSFQYI